MENNEIEACEMFFFTRMLFPLVGMSAYLIKMLYVQTN